MALHSQNSSPLMARMMEVAHRSSKALIRDFGELTFLQSSQQGPLGYGTRTYERVQKYLKEDLATIHPVPVLGKRDDFATLGDFWFIEPIDGFENFVRSIPHFAVVIFLIQRGVSMAGIVYDPLQNELFWSEEKRGMFLNSQRVHVSKRAPEKGLFFMQGMDPSLPGKKRFMGAPMMSLAYVAAGRGEGAILPISPLARFIAKLMIHEAGGGFEETTTLLRVFNKSLVDPSFDGN